MLSAEQIYWLVFDCQIVTVSVVWLAIQQTLKWFFDDKKQKHDITVQDESEI